MKGPGERWTDKRVESIVGNLLRVGVLLSAAVVLAGGILYLIHYGGNAPDYRVFRGEPEELKGITDIVKDALSLRRRALIQFGLLLLIATPVARVVFAVIAFALQRDVTYVIISLIVLSTLLFSLFLGGLQ
jgi:uncharacterized membrane protein